MLYLEMSRDSDHGGGSWDFTKCVWAPTLKANGGSWPYWTKVREVKEGDTILHLRGATPRAEFVGYSIASTDGFETSSRPPNPKSWSYSEKFFRADLRDFHPFHTPVNLDDVFAERRAELESYFDSNRQSGPNKKNIFFVRQSGRLQCQNGAYFSEVDDKLFAALFGADEGQHAEPHSRFLTVETRTQIASVKARVGQKAFSDAIRSLYGQRCCFPGCQIADSRFLVGSHIARWSDNESLRGDLRNGLCLCLVHDKAFELGLYTIDEQFRVFMNPSEAESESEIVQKLRAHEGEQIRLASTTPLPEALLEHWNRVDITPVS